LIEKDEVVEYSQRGAFFYMERFGNAEKVIANYLVFKVALQIPLSGVFKIDCKWRLEGIENRKAMAGLQWF
jgi:hypothetical protein